MFGSEKKTGGYPKTGQVVEIPIEDIAQNPEQTRQAFSYEKLLALSVSIAENGLLQPVTVCLQNGRPQLIAGERRLRAAKLACMKRIPCLIADRTERDRAVLTLAENLQREALNPFEEAQAIARLIHVHGLSQEEVAYRLGYAQPTVANKLRLLRLPSEQREKILAAGLTERHARALLRIEDPGLRDTMLDKVIRDKMTVAGTERMVEAALTGRRRKLPPPLLRDVRVFAAATALTATLALNEVLVLQGALTDASYGHLQASEQWLNAPLCAVNVLIALLMLWTSFDLCVRRHTLAWREPEAPEPDRGGAPRSDHGLHMVKWDYLLMAGLPHDLLRRHLRQRLFRGALQRRRELDGPLLGPLQPGGDLPLAVVRALHAGADHRV